MEETFEGKNLTDWYINLKAVMHDTDFLPSTRLLAALLKENPYMTVGQYFNITPDSDVFTLSDRVDRDDLHELLLLAEMLSAAEGCKSEDIEDVTDHVNTFCGFVVCESLSRKGLADVMRENMSFDKQYGGLKIVRAKTQ